MVDLLKSRLLGVCGCAYNAHNIRKFQISQQVQQIQIKNSNHIEICVIYLFIKSNLFIIEINLFI